MTYTQVGNFDYTIPGEYFGDFADDFDTAAIDDDVCDAINAKLPDGVTLARNGMIFAELEVANEAREIDFAELLGAVDMEPILAKHETKAE